MRAGARRRCWRRSSPRSCERRAQPFLQPIYDLDSPRMAFGRVALLGDAAFVARPHVGMGVTKAGDDAMALAQRWRGRARRRRR